MTESGGLAPATDASSAPSELTGRAAVPNGQVEPVVQASAPNGPYEAEGPRLCTGAQLRRFIKSRPYVPMHELRRRFELNGEADEVSPIQTADGIVFLGLPARESELIGDLVRQGDVGVELCRDPVVPIVVGVYPMRPIPRQ
jgi:hypothetical protein